MKVTEVEMTMMMSYIEVYEKCDRSKYDDDEDGEGYRKEHRNGGVDNTKK